MPPTFRTPPESSAMVIVFLVLPILMTLFLAKICLFDIVIDAKGIHKIRFKKETFFISWDELKDIRLYNTSALWIVFAKESLIKIKLEIITKINLNLKIQFTASVVVITLRNMVMI